MEKNDVIRFRLSDVDIAGNLVAGILLSNLRIMEFSDNCAVDGSGKKWIVMDRKNIWDNLRMHSKRFNTSIKTLEQNKIIEKFNVQNSSGNYIHVHLMR